MNTFNRDVRVEVDSEGYSYEVHTLRWGNMALTEGKQVRWGGVLYSAGTDNGEGFDIDNQHFVMCLLDWEVIQLPDGKTPWTEQDYAQIQLVGRISALYIDERGLLYAEICTGQVEVREVKPPVYSPRDVRILYRGLPRRNGYLQTEDPYTYLLCDPETILLPEPVGDVSQLVKVEPDVAS